MGKEYVVHSILSRTTKVTPMKTVPCIPTMGTVGAEAEFNDLGDATRQTLASSQLHVSTSP